MHAKGSMLAKPWLPALVACLVLSTQISTQAPAQEYPNRG
jgi:hypothetical protein